MAYPVFPNGTNALVAVLSDADYLDETYGGALVSAAHIAPDTHVIAGTVDRWIWPQDDVNGFATYVHDNADTLAGNGYGLHYGTWDGTTFVDVNDTPFVADPLAGPAVEGAPE